MCQKDIERRLESVEKALEELIEFVEAVKNGFIVVEQMSKDASALKERIGLLEQGKEEPPKWIT